MNYSEQFKIAMFKSSRYKELLELPRKKFIRFALLLSIFVTIFTYVVPVAATITGFGGFEKLITQNLSSIKYSDGVMSLDKTFKLKFLDTLIVIDTSSDSVDDKKIADGSFVAIGSRNIDVGVKIQGETQKMVSKLSDMMTVDFDSRLLARCVPGLYGYVVFFAFFDAIGVFIKYAIFAVFITFLLRVITRVSKTEYSFGKLFCACFYAQTLAIIIGSINQALGLIPDAIASFILLFYTFHMVTMFLVLGRKREDER